MTVYRVLQIIEFNSKNFLEELDQLPTHLNATF